MTKTPLQEIQSFSTELPQLKETVSHYLMKSITENQLFLKHSELPETTKSYCERYQLIAQTILDALTLLDTYFKTYLTVLIETITDPVNKLKVNELHQLQTELTQLQQEKRRFMESMSKSFSDVPTLKKLFTTTALNQKKKEIDFIQRHSAFEIVTQEHLSNIQLTILSVKQGVLFLKKTTYLEDFDSTKLPWCAHLFEFTSGYKTN